MCAALSLRGQEKLVGLLSVMNRIHVVSENTVPMSSCTVVTLGDFTAESAATRNLAGACRMLYRHPSHTFWITVPEGGERAGRDALGAAYADLVSIVFEKDRSERQRYSLVGLSRSRAV